MTYQQNNSFNKYGNYNKGGYGGNKYGGGNNSGTGGSNFEKRDAPLPEPIIYKPYAIAGNANVPPDVLTRAKKLATDLETFGYVVRVGGTDDGLDVVFESSVKEPEIHVPWKGFNNKQTKLYFSSPMARAIARMYHPAYDGFNFKAHGFLARNVRLILGKDLTSRALFLVCWSDDGVESVEAKTSKTGNIGHVIAIAGSLKIPIFNLARPDAEKRLKQYLGLPYEQTQSIQEI